MRVTSLGMCSYCEFHPWSRLEFITLVQVTQYSVLAAALTFGNHLCDIFLPGNGLVSGSSELLNRSVQALPLRAAKIGILSALVAVIRLAGSTVSIA